MPSSVVHTLHATLNDYRTEKALQQLMRWARGAAGQTSIFKLLCNGVAVGMHIPERHRPNMLLAVRIRPLQQTPVAMMAVIARPGQDIERAADLYFYRFLFVWGGKPKTITI
jgi:hypothetical protein